MLSWAIYFAWHYGLRDHVAARALGVPETLIRSARRRLNLRKRAGGQPA